MVQITLKGNPIHTVGSIPPIGGKIADFTLVDKDLKDRHLHEFLGEKIVLTTVPSLDTGVCRKMTKTLNDLAKKHVNVTFLTVSADLPFAQKRFCEVEHIQNVLTLSTMRGKEFGEALGLLIKDGPLAGALARSLIFIDEKGRTLYIELVPEITHEPNYSALDKLL